MASAGIVTRTGPWSVEEAAGRLVDELVTRLAVTDGLIDPIVAAERVDHRG